jgi:hypothetical protein
VALRAGPETAVIFSEALIERDLSSSRTTSGSLPFGRRDGALKQTSEPSTTPVIGFDLPAEMQYCAKDKFG